MVVEHLRSLGQPLKGFSVRHQAVIETPDGEFALDGLAAFEALGVDFMVLVECKHHRNPIKRELVQVLESKLSSTHAQKAMMYSTATFQKGAIEFAAQHHIALVQFTAGDVVYKTRDMQEKIGPVRLHDAYSVALNQSGLTSYSSDHAELAEMLFAGTG